MIWLKYFYAWYVRSRRALSLFLAVIFARNRRWMFTPNEHNTTTAAPALTITPTLSLLLTSPHHHRRRPRRPTSHLATTTITFTTPNPNNRHKHHHHPPTYPPPWPPHPPTHDHHHQQPRLSAGANPLISVLHVHRPSPSLCTITPITDHWSLITDTITLYTVHSQCSTLTTDNWHWHISHI